MKNEEKKPENAIKKGKVIHCKYVDKWMQPMSKKFIYYHEVITDSGDVLTIGTMEENSPRIEKDAVIYFTADETGKAKLVSSSNDTKPVENNTKTNSSEQNTGAKTQTRVKGQEAFLGYAWSYAKDLIIAGKTMEDVEELNNVARFIYNEIGKMLNNE